MRQSDSANLTIATPEAMRALGQALGSALLSAGDALIVVTIQGELGAGKTTLVGGVLNAVGVAGPARSPTYTLIEPYAAHGRHIYHLDLYRLADPFEVEALGIRDLLTRDAVLLIEWPERGVGKLPAADIAISIRYSEASVGNGRDVVIAAVSDCGTRLIAQLTDAVE